MVCFISSNWFYYDRFSSYFLFCFRRENVEKLLVEARDRERVENDVSNAAKTRAEHFERFQKDLEDHAKALKNRTQSELDAISNELKREFGKNSDAITDGWSRTLESFKNAQSERVKRKLAQSAENVERDADVEIRRFDSEFKEKLQAISEDKLRDVAEQLDAALRDEIDLVKKRIDKNRRCNGETSSLDECRPKPLKVDCPKRDQSSE